MRRGFTAPELAMSALLILVITAVITAADHRLRGRAQDMQCLSSVKQLATALLMYAEDNSLRLPPERKAWPAVLPYFKNLQVLRCPYGPQSAEEARRREGATGSPGEPETPEPAPPPGSVSDYVLKPGVAADESPTVIVAGDDAPGRHPGQRWVGARLDGATALYPAEQWPSLLGGE